MLISDVESLRSVWHPLVPKMVVGLLHRYKFGNTS